MTSATHIEALLRERIGLDAASIGAGSVARTLGERMRVRSVHDVAAYWALLHADPAEFQALIEAVVVPETLFFRHPEALTALGRYASARAAGGSHWAGPLRVLSVPCSTGEEPYSIAMALLDAGLAPGRFRVDAIDISARALQRARIAEYGRNSFRGTALDFRERYFSPVGDHYVLRQTVRAQVRLLQGNLMDPGLLAGEPPYDFVFCRNLLIYFDAATQERALHTLERLTSADGMLFVGPAEASLLTRHGLTSAGVPLSFAFHKARPAAEAPRRVSAAPAAAVATASRPAVAAVRARPAPAAPWRNTPAAGSKPAEPDALGTIAALADRGELDAAIAACRAHLAAQGPSAAAYCLLGVLHDAQGQAAQAREGYRRALYLDPGHPEALHHLAALLDAEGDSDGAARLRQRAQRAQRVASAARTMGAGHG
jgi:chemotaxis protein methyltransferase WspC